MTKETAKRKLSFFLVLLLIINCFWNTGILQARAEEPDPETLEYLEYLNEDLQTVLEDGEVMAVLYKTEQYPVRTAPDTDASSEVTLYSGATVFLTGVALDSDYSIWSRVGFYYQEEYITGYIERDFLLCTDERYKEWEAMNGLDPSMVSTMSLSVSDGDVRSSFDEVNQFPESYRAALDALKEKHPNWHFTPMVTNLDWKTTIDNEIGAKSLIYYTFEDWNKDGLYDEHNWYYATREILEYYMDPRNGLTEDRIFQFEQLTYNESYHTLDAIKSFLNGTFMEEEFIHTKTGERTTNLVPGTTVMTYPFTIWAIAAEEGRRVSPFHLASRIIQEQGRGSKVLNEDGSYYYKVGDLISGVYPGFEGYYNYFNCGAGGKTHEEVVRNGLTYAQTAKDRQGRPYPWTDGYRAILGGADKLTLDYIQKGQDTLYLQKYNVNPNGYYKVYTHQYMQNISAPTTEAKNIKNQYEKAGALEMEFNFKIPVYLNMPEAAVPYPTIEENLYLTIPEGYDTTTIYVDGVAYPTATRFGYQVADLPNTDAKSAIAYKYNAAGVPEGMYVWELAYTQKNKKYKATALPNFENLLTYHGFSIRIRGKAGMRVKSGIDYEKKVQMCQGDIDGYKLVEHGTIIMKDERRAQYPMVLHGEKTMTGMSFGEKNGETIDNVYDIAQNINIYTGVLVGLPVSEYKTVFACRAYAVLEKNGNQVVLYGPIRTRSIYNVADNYLKKNTYADGTPEKAFLEKLIADADAYAAEQAAKEEAERLAAQQSNPDTAATEGTQEE